MPRVDQAVRAAESTEASVPACICVLIMSRGARKRADTTTEDAEDSATKAEVPSCNGGAVPSSGIKFRLMTSYAPVPQTSDL